MPELVTTGLWNVQIEAIRNLKLSLAANHPRAVIRMATGSGKTFTAVTTSYRLIKFGKVKRILFLVDRNNLGRQTLNEFQQYVVHVPRVFGMFLPCLFFLFLGYKFRG